MEDHSLKNPDSRRSQALVIGGSITGLLVARILSDFFDHVSIVERDRFPAEPTARKGVPQAHHVHVLLVRGQQILEQLFPGLDEELANAGAPEVDWGMESINIPSSGKLPPFQSQLVTRTSSRELLEWVLRQRLASLENVVFLEQCEVTGLLADPTHQIVKGVQYRNRATRQADQRIETDLVVDASGRDSDTPSWLEALGYRPPKKTVINSFLGYATRWYEVPNHTHHPDWKATVMAPRFPDNPRGGVLYPVEGNRWVVTLAGIGGNYPPNDEAEFMEFAQKLVSPLIFEAIREANPVSPIYSYRRTENVWHHYEQLTRWPEGFLVMGDAVCAFNPVYGQGMTVSAMGALALKAHLQTSPSEQFPSGWAMSFQKVLAKINHTAWLLATGEDFRWPTTKGGEPDIRTRIMHRYVNRVAQVYCRDPEVARIFFEIVHMIRPPTELLGPRVLGPVMAHGFKSLWS